MNFGDRTLSPDAQHRDFFLRFRSLEHFAALSHDGENIVSGQRPRVLMKVDNAVKIEPVGEFELKGIKRTDEDLPGFASSRDQAR
jgi:hypothetical protein